MLNHKENIKNIKRYIKGNLLFFDTSWALPRGYSFGTIVVLFCIIVLKLHAVISLLLAALVTGLLTSPELIFNYAIHSGISDQQAQTMSSLGIGKRLATAFGNTSGKIGILIAFASIIGTSLMKSGCLLYTSDAADDLLCVDLGGRRII